MVALDPGGRAQNVRGIIARVAWDRQTRFLSVKVGRAADLAGIDALGELEALELQLGMTRVPDVVFELSSLRRLTVTGRKCKTLSPEIEALSELQELRLSGNALTKLPDELGALAKLERLDVSNNALTQLPATLGGCRSLQDLAATSNRIAELPASVAELTALTHLHLDKNPKIDLAADFDGLPALVGLGLRNCKLEAIPAWVFGCKALRSLSLGMNPLGILPADVGKLTKLRQLYVWGCKLEEVPAALGKLRQLELLEIEKNELSALPPELAKLTKLRTLRLEKNRFTEVPPVVFDLGTLTELTAMDNAITELPDPLTRLTNLVKLEVHGNPIARFPADLRPLAALKTWYVSPTSRQQMKAQIEHLPPEAFVMSFEIGDLARGGRWTDEPAPRSGDAAEHAVVHFEGRVASVAFVADGVAAAGYDCLRVVELDGTERWSKQGCFFDVAASPDGTQVLAYEHGAGLRQLDARTGADLPAPPHRTSRGGWSADGTLRIVRSKGAIAIVDADGKTVDEIAEPRGIAFAVLSPDNALVFYGVKKTVRVFDRGKGKERFRVTADRFGIAAGVFSPDGDKAYAWGTDEGFKVLDLAAKKPKPVTVGGEVRSQCVAIFGDGTRAATIDDEAKVRIWDLSTGEVLHTLPGHDKQAGPVDDIAASADGRYLASCGCDKTLRIWSVPG